MRRLLVAVVLMLAAPSVHAEPAPARVHYRALTKMLKRFEKEAQLRATAQARAHVLAAR